jgi:hypothetical protein
VDVRIDEPRQYRRIAKILNFRYVRRNLAFSCHLSDFFPINDNGAWTHPLRGHDSAGKEGAQGHSEDRLIAARLLRLRQEGSPISMVFQLAKIDNSTPKKCCQAVFRAYTGSPARAVAGVI